MMPIRKREIAENVLKSMENAKKSAQQKRGPPIRQSICVQTSVKKKRRVKLKNVKFGSLLD